MKEKETHSYFSVLYEVSILEKIFWTCLFQIPTSLLLMDFILKVKSSNERIDMQQLL